MPGRVGLVTVVEDAAGCLGDPRPRAGARLVGQERSLWRLVGRDHANRLVEPRTRFRGADDDADVGIPARPGDAGLASELLNLGRGPIGVQVPARQRADEVRPATLATALQGIGVRHLVLLEMLGELVHGDVQAPAGHQPALVHRIVGLVPQGHELVIVLERREVQTGRPADELSGDFLDRLQLFGERGHLGRTRNPVETAQPAR